MNGNEKQCPVCGAIFNKTNNAQKYCSIECREESRRISRSLKRFKKCSWCGKEFEAEGKTKYCSDDCRFNGTGKKGKIKKRKKSFKSIEEVARASKEMGISAGEYMTKFCYGKEN